MTDPASRAKPVGPPSEPGRPSATPPPSGAGPTQPPPGVGPDGAPSGQPPYMRVYSWSSSGPSIPWFAILLVVVGIGLLFQELTGLGFMAVVGLALGIALAVLWLWRGVIGATVPSFVLIAWGGVNVLADAGVVSGDGWSTLAVGGAFLLGWLVGRYQSARRTWALWIGAVLGIVGLSEVSEVLPAQIDAAAVMAIVLIGLGIFLIARSRLPQPNEPR